MVWPCEIQQSKFMELQHQSAHGTFKKFSASSTSTKFGAPSTLLKSCAPGTTNCPLCSVMSFLLPAWSVSRPVFRWTEFLAGIQLSLQCQGCLTSWSTSRGTGSGLLATSSVPQWCMGRASKHVVPTMYCKLCFVMESHTAKVGLLATAGKSYIYCAFLIKRRQFSYDFQVGCWPAVMLLLILLHFSITNHQP